MSRAARRRAEREAAKKADATVGLGKHQVIKLQNPVADLYDTFVVGNAMVCEKVCEFGSRAGKTIVVCGAGPSLAEEADEWCGQGDELWAANSALTWLLERDFPVTHAITVDQTPAMLNEWWSAPDVEYLLASTVHPHLTDHLMQKGRSISFFHNFVGIAKPAVSYCECGHDHPIEHVDGMDRYRPTCPECSDCTTYRPRVMSYEDWLYVTLYPPTVRCGSGLNTVTRAIDLAFALGAEKVIALGADCALRVNHPLPEGTRVGSPEHKRWLLEETTMHADGGHALASGATPVTIGGEIDGRWWETKPDMAISAMFLHRMRETLGEDRLVLVGDTLPNAIKDKPDEFLAKMPALMDSNGEPIFVKAHDPLLTTEPAVV